jgi:predicted transcriptional regulator
VSGIIPIAIPLPKGIGYAELEVSEGPMKVSDLVGSRKQIFSISEDKSVMEAAQYLREKQVRSVGVVNADGKLTGVISQSDISDKVAAENKCPAWMKVSDIMTRELLTVTPEMTFEDSLRAMEQNGVYHLLIVDVQYGYQGMLSVSDLLRVLTADNKERADLLESYIFPSR